MSNKFFSIIVVIFSFVLFLLTLGLKYIIDPVGINNKFNIGIHKNPNLSARLHKFVLMNKEKPNSIMLGGSRIQYLSTEDVKLYTKDNVLNLAMSSSQLEEQYLLLKYSIDNFDIKHVIIGINLYTFSNNAKPMSERKTDFDRNLFDTGFGFKESLKYYSYYPFFYSIKFYLKYSPEEVLQYKGSHTLFFEEKKQIGNRSWEERLERSNKGYSKVYSENLEYGMKNTNIFKKMIELCKEKGVKYYVFTTAVHIEQMKILSDLNKMYIYYQWKKDLANITPYWDFMYANEVTANPDNFIDGSHVKQKIGVLYFEKIFGAKTQYHNANFGRYVDKSNIEQHVQEITRYNQKYGIK